MATNKTMTSRISFAVVLLGGCALSSGPSFAEGEAALYEASAPAGSAFVRVINNEPERLSVSTPVKSEAQQLSSFEVGEYLFVPGGKDHQFSLYGHQITRNFAEESATTLVASKEGISELEDTYFTGRKKALISFYNLTSQSIALKTENGKHTVVDALESLSNGTRKINEVKIGLAAWGDSGVVATFPPTFLKKGRSYSYVAYEHDGSIKSVVMPDAISTIE
ncbi:MAG: alginate O-acetyltransferase AlgF [Marinobacter sp.]